METTSPVFFFELTEMALAFLQKAHSLMFTPIYDNPDLWMFQNPALEVLADILGWSLHWTPFQLLLGVGLPTVFALMFFSKVWSLVRP